VAVASALCAVALLALGAAPSFAATATVRGCFDDPNYCDDLLFQAAPGEVNTLTRSGSATAPVLTDSTATLTAESGCTQLSAHAVRCALTQGQLNETTINLGDMGDVATLPGAGGVTLDAGPGQDDVTGGGNGDVIDGGTGDDTIRGGGGSDDLLGGGGRDSLYGQGGDDVLTDGDGPATDAHGANPVDNDTLDGGSGADKVDYSERTEPLAIDLSTGGGGEAVNAEFDKIVNDEIVYGGAGDDSLIGKDGPDALYGQGGDDTIDSGKGNDLVDGGGDQDQISTGPGKDTIYDASDRFDGNRRLATAGSVFAATAGDAIGADVDCGSGKDVVNRPKAHDYLQRTCETVLSDNEDVPRVPLRETAQPKVTATTVTFDQTCLPAPKCNGKAKLWRLSKKRTLLGAVSFDHPGLKKSKRVLLRIVLNAKGRKLVKKGGLARLTISAPFKTGWIVRIPKH
jgi:hypothetical protein